MKEDQLILLKNTQFTEMPQLSINKVQELKFWLLVLRSSTCWLPMPEVVKLDFSEVPESEKLCWFKNWLTTSPRPTVVTPCSQEWVKEPEKETIFITKWLNQVSLKLTKLVPDALWSTDKWTSPQVLEPESDWLV